MFGGENHPPQAHADDPGVADVSLAAPVAADDPSVLGGFVVAAEEGKIRIVNTLTKRLAILWSEQLPKIMADVRKEQP